MPTASRARNHHEHATALIHLLGLDLGPSTPLPGTCPGTLRLHRMLGIATRTTLYLPISNGTVYDNDANVYDVYYDVNDEMDVGDGDPTKRPNGPWSDGRINHSPTGQGSNTPCPCLIVTKQNLI